MSKESNFSKVSEISIESQLGENNKNKNFNPLSDSRQIHETKKISEGELKNYFGNDYLAMPTCEKEKIVYNLINSNNNFENGRDVKLEDLLNISKKIDKNGFNFSLNLLEEVEEEKHREENLKTKIPSINPRNDENNSHNDRISNINNIYVNNKDKDIKKNLDQKINAFDKEIHQNSQENSKSLEKEIKMEANGNVKNNLISKIDNLNAIENSPIIKSNQEEFISKLPIEISFNCTN